MPCNYRLELFCNSTALPSLVNSLCLTGLDGFSGLHYHNLGELVPSSFSRVFFQFPHGIDVRLDRIVWCAESPGSLEPCPLAYIHKLCYNSSVMDIRTQHRAAVRLLR